MVSRFQGSGRPKEGGFLATHKQDFNAHHTGGDFRHTADHTDMNPPLPLFSAPTVQETLELISGFAASTGSGFVSVGNVGADGYATGSYNVGTSSTPTFREAILAAFGDSRLQNGGIVFVLPGTYKLNTTVEVPAGISVMGEISGTVIVGEMSEEPMFRFLRSIDFPTVGGDTGGGDISADVGSPTDESRLFNIILADNLDGYVGSTGQPDSTMQTVPMVEIEAASRVHVENVKFLGRVNNGPEVGRGKTKCAIGYTAGGTTGSYLTVRRGFFDGMQIGIDFEPGNGDVDHLTVDQCRARVFGEEGAFTAFSKNCFVAMTRCNFVATNNFVVGYGSTPNQFILVCFVVKAPALSSSGINVLVTGTSGAPSGGYEQAKIVFWDETINASPGLSYRAVVTGNNWGGDVDSTWFVTVGQATNLLSTTFGDFNGPGAIDLLLSLADGFPAALTVIVNKGTYDVTEEHFSASKFTWIGNVDDSHATEQIPIFDMNLGAGAYTDKLTHRTFRTGRLENIHFKSSGGTQFHSIRPYSTHQTIVKNCKFENCTLSFDEGTERIQIINCEFEQDGTFSDDACLLAPRADYILVEGCYFTGNGYVGLIGTDPGLGFGYSLSAPSNTAQIIVRDCVMAPPVPTNTITGASPFTIPAYFVIDAGSDYHRVEISGCQILSSNLPTFTTLAIGAGALAGFQSWVFVRARNIYVDNSIFCGTVQRDVSYVIPTAQFVPWRTARITNSKFFMGGPTQITGFGGDGIRGGDRGDGVFVEGCTFSALGSPQTITLLDVDLDPGATPGEATVSVSDCNFDMPFDLNDPFPVEHFDMISTPYVAMGIVQIYAYDFTVRFHDNTLFGIVPDFDGPLPAGFAHATALAVQTNLDDGGNSGSIIRQTNVHDNDIEALSIFDSATATESATVLWVGSLLFDVHDNYLRYENLGGTSGAAVGCAWFETSTTSAAQQPSKSLVHSNTFSRRSRNGTATNIGRGAGLGGYIYIPATSLSGTINGNTFSDDTIDGSGESLVEDSSNSWVSFNNVNEIKVVTLRGGNGQIGFNDGGNEPVVVRGTTIPTATLSLCAMNPTSPIRCAVLGHRNAGTPLNLFWTVPLNDIIPYGAEVIHVDVYVNVTSNGVGVSRSDFRIYLGGAFDQNLSASPLTTAGHTHVLETAAQGGAGPTLMTNTYRNDPTIYTPLYLLVLGDRFNFAGSADYYVGEITIKYRL